MNQKTAVKALFFSVITILLLLMPEKSSFSQKKPLTSADNIRTSITGKENKYIKITWNMTRKNSGDYVLGRSDKPILTIKDVLKCKLMGIFNPAQRGEFIDQSVNTGKQYYYVILTKKELNGNNITLYNNINTTSNSVVVEKARKMVKSIDASAGWNKIKIEWDRSEDKYKYALYRANSPIASIKELKIAKRITVTDDDEFTDKKISKYRTYFYAVSIIDGDREFFIPKKDENFTTTGVFIKASSSSTPLNITAFLKDKTDIIIKWIKPEIKSDKELNGYEIYRNSVPIVSSLKLKESTLIKIADIADTFFIDKNLPAGRWYYAIFPRFKDGSIDINFTGKGSHTANAIVIGQEYKIDKVYIEKIKNRVFLRWDYSGNFGNNQFQVTGLDIPEPKLSTLKINRISWVRIQDRKIEITGKTVKYKYLAIIPENTSNERYLKIGIDTLESTPHRQNKRGKSKKNKSDNTLPEKIDYNGGQEYYKNNKLDSDGSKRLDWIIKSTFYKENYSKSIDELNEFIKSSSNIKDRKKALLFIGKSYIELKNYRMAMKILNDKNFRDFYRDEAKFWFKFATMRLN